ncbi:uncharacterized protein ABDE67_015174 [Symphorus nematophorus]
MAAVRQRLGRGAYDFAHKTRNRYLLESRNKQGKSAIQTSSLSAGPLFGDIQDGGLCGAENRVTVGVSQDNYTRAVPSFGTGEAVWKNGNIAECYIGLNKEQSLPIEADVQNTERKSPHHQSYAKFRRSFGTLTSARRLHSLGSPRPGWGHGQFVFIRAYSGNGARSEPLFKTKTGYYEILEVMPSATQAQIKTAYFKQSFIYHPDRNAGSDAATVRFSEISEAYTVLGNKALRKKYDRGLLSQSDLVATARPSGKDTTGSSAKQQTGSQRSVVGKDSRGGVFDFDNFFKAHYNEQLQRDKDIRARREEMIRKELETIEEMKLGRFLEVGAVLMLALAVAIVISLKQR